MLRTVTATMPECAAFDAQALLALLAISRSEASTVLQAYIIQDQQQQQGAEYSPDLQWSPLLLNKPAADVVCLAARCDVCASTCTLKVVAWLVALGWSLSTPCRCA